MTEPMTLDLIPIRRALVSVFDKEGIEPLARCLASFGCELISSGGTRDHLSAAGIPTTDVSAVTGNPAAFDGRMKTISFALESGLLFHRHRHAAEAARLGIVPLDMVVCTFYPFEAASARGLALDDLVDYIDIGGPTMVRAAAKNARFVAAVTDPADYGAVVEELTTHAGALTGATRFALMRKAFATTADYEAAIATALDAHAGLRSLRPTLESGRPARYGENPHQQAAIYRVRGARSTLYDCPLVHGKELSYNNMVDLQRALEAVRDLPRHGVGIIKHTNPCGLADADDQRRAFQLAWDGDPVSAFGSVVAFSTAARRDTVELLAFDQAKEKRRFIEVIAAPYIDEDAMAYLVRQKNLRIVLADPRSLVSSSEIRIALGTALVQDPDRKLMDEMTVAGRVHPVLDRPLVEFGVAAARGLASNGIAVVRRLPDGACQLLGMGCGQPNRVGSVELALNRSVNTLLAECPDRADADAHVRRQLGMAVVVSDGFLPFPDNVDACARRGVRLIVQPGGSVRDAEVVRRADECGIAMVFTGIRHFRH